ncbi:GlxA family transcriptional regulator [Pseudaestuariivita atlantica]|uniref:AraC family transcriptional regulator n=1 Tax=Pseudaestuariivita atlantica TaxID=1317121 RepID=A0A0L1JUT2_9RHOB|nr:helix-turn-helix domain-containing protein [Pseudaestuariivita atlantica]KNG95526.1 AraC family transcriptional regulator [Pseudaestuariivita atlantica]
MQEWTKPADEATSVAFVLFDRFSNLCLANCLEPLRAANTLAGRDVFAWRFYSPDGAAVRSSSELPVLPDAALADMPRVDLMVVLASYDHLRHDTPQTRRLLNAAARRAKVVVGHDAGPWLLAAAGVLAGHTATLHRDLIDPFAERFLDVTVLDDPVVRDRARLTSAGAMAAYDLTLDLVRDVCGAALTLDIEALFLSDAAPRGRQREPRDPVLARMLAEMRRTLGAPIPVADLAARLGLRTRTLDRRCRAGLGASPGQVYRHLRLSAGVQMITTTRLPLSEIALRCGYETPTAFTRAIRARFGATPRALRARPEMAQRPRN